MPAIPVITPVRLARVALAGLVVAGLASSGLAFAAGWTGPSSPAPLNNTPELIWNAQETGFTPQNASFNITGSGVLGQFAAGGFGLDASGIAITAPSLWATNLGAGDAVVYGDLAIDPGTGSLTLGGETRTTWPVSAGGDITGISAGPNLVGGGDTGDVSLDLSPTPTVDTLQVNTSAAIPSVDFSGTGAGRLFWSGTFSRLEFSSQPFFSQGLTTGSGTVSTFSGPLNVTGPAGMLTAQAGVRATNVCTFGGTACSGAPYSGSDKVSTSEICIGSDCRTSWPAGGGGGAGTVTSISSGTGITATPSPITGAGTIAFDQAYGDGRYVNAAGDLTMAGSYQINTGTLNVVANSASDAVRGGNSGAGPGVRGDAQGGVGVLGSSVSNTGVYGSSSSGIGIRGLSTSNYGVLGQGSIGGRFLNSAGGITTSIATSAEGVTSNGRIQAPEYCIGASCITDWPAGGAGGGGTVTSVGSGVGITGGPITGAGTLALDTVYADGLYLNHDGDETKTGSLAISKSTADPVPVLRVNNTGSGQGLFVDSFSGTAIRATGFTSAGSFGNTSGAGTTATLAANTSAGSFTRGATTVSLATATRGVDANQPIQAPQFCIGASCISAWPAGGSGTVTSITAGSGLTATPAPITGAGTISLDTSFSDSRYLNNTGPDQIIGEFGVNSTSGFQSLDVNNTGTGSGARIRSSSGISLVVQNSAAAGAAGYFSNGSGLYTYIAWGGTYGVYTTGRIRAGTGIELGGVFKTAWPTITQVTRTNVAIAAGWNNAPTACPVGSVVAGISCFNWDAGRNYPGCTSRGKALTPGEPGYPTPDNNVQLYGGGFNVSYTLFCLQ
ncbi:hypothetical protein EPO33_02150 [Patescibacteria group bacterium]|nr:MAG: hypothetical protein EPO33_02150 [Patescibacteria group bacterium]